MRTTTHCRSDIDSRLSLSRRDALLAAVASSEIACRSLEEKSEGATTGRVFSADVPRASASSAPSSFDSGGLEVATLARMGEEERGGAAVVLLHGWGAGGDDLVPLARALARPKTRFFLPAGPLAEHGGGRAWWHLDASDRPVHAYDDELPAGFQPHPQVAAVRAAVQTLLRSIQSRYAPDALMIGGFSQGAMLSLDVALAAEPAVERVAVLSGVLLADSLGGLRSPRSARPKVFVSHGRQDPVLPFKGGERAKDLLVRHGFDVSWRPFDGGHEIPAAVVSDMKAFLFDRRE